MIRKSLMRLLVAFRRQVDLSYDGEFGYELISVIPYAYWLHEQGKLGSMTVCNGMEPFYYFSQQYKAGFEQRRYVTPKGYPIQNIHVRFLNTMMWSPPPYKDIYKNQEFVFEKPLLIVCNKYNSEWDYPPITFLSKDCLARLFETYSDQYQIVYCRPQTTHIPKDNSTVYDLEEHNWIRESYPNVMLIQDLYELHKGRYSFNEMQLRCFANADRFISIQGGYSILCSYFKGTNIVYGARTKHRTADEIVYKAFDRWYHKFSGAKVVYCDSYDRLYRVAESEFLNV